MKGALDFISLFLEVAAGAALIYLYFQRATMSNRLREVQTELQLARNKLEAHREIRAIS